MQTDSTHGTIPTTSRINATGGSMGAPITGREEGQHPGAMVTIVLGTWIDQYVAEIRQVEVVIAGRAMRYNLNFIALSLEHACGVLASSGALGGIRMWLIFAIQSGCRSLISKKSWGSGRHCIWKLLSTAGRFLASLSSCSWKTNLHSIIFFVLAFYFYSPRSPSDLLGT